MFKAVSLVLLLALAGATAQDTSIVSVVEGNPDFAELYSRLALFPDLVAALSDPGFNGTVFAPTNEGILNAHYKLTKAAAFDGLALTPELLRAALTYHVVPSAAARAADLTNGQQLPTLNADAPPLEVEIAGDTVRIQSVGSVATVVTPDVAVNDAVVHVIDEMLLPIEVPDIQVDSLVEAAQLANLTSLLSAVEAAGLVDAVTAFQGTVVAPTNAAFEAAMAFAAGAGLELTPEVLGQILTYHLINGTQVYSNQLVNGTAVTTLGGQDLTVVLEDGTAYFQDANGGRAAVLIPDVKVGDNVVVHVIDAVLLPSLDAAPAPEAAEASEAPVATPAAPGNAASSAAGSVAALAGAALAAALLV